MAGLALILGSSWHCSGCFTCRNGLHKSSNKRIGNQSSSSTKSTNYLEIARTKKMRRITELKEGETAYTVPWGIFQKKPSPEGPTSLVPSWLAHSPSK